MELIKKNNTSVEKKSEINMTQANIDNIENDITIYSTTETLFSRLMTTEYYNVTYGSDLVINNISGSSYSDDVNITKEYIFDRKDVRYVFITLYSLVFCFCFFGEYRLMHD